MVCGRGSKNQDNGVGSLVHIRCNNTQLSSSSRRFRAAEEAVMVVGRLDVEGLRNLCVGGGNMMWASVTL